MKHLFFLTLLLPFCSFAQDAVDGSWNEKGVAAMEAGKPLDEVKALFQKGVDAGETDAMLNLAHLVKGEQAKKLILAASEKKDPAALCFAGIYLYADGKTDDALKYLNESAALGFLPAHYYLGVHAELQKDFAVARKEYLAAGEDDPKALNRYGILLYTGRGWEKPDPAAAFKSFCQAGLLDYAPAMNNSAFAVVHHKELAAGMESGHFAEYWYKKAINAGYVPAMYNLARLYSGDGGEAFLRPNEAVRYLQMAAEKNHPAAWYLLGTAYRSGIGGLPVDEAKMKKCFEKAAALNNQSAKNELSVADGLESDEKK